MLTYVSATGMLLCMRTTLSLDEDLMRKVKRRAVDTDQTVSAMVETALRDLLERESKPRKKHPFRWVTVKGRLLPGVDLTDRNSLYDIMENRS